MNYSSSGVTCLDSCQVIATHAYSLNMNFRSENFGLAAYDLQAYSNTFGTKPIWQTEVSSTYASAQDHQMEEGLSLATNIVNFVGTTCVERYYFWLAFTVGPSGESLIWGNKDTGELTLPKKYYIYNQFTNASRSSGPVRVKSCVSDHLTNLVTDPVTPCLQFDSKNTVFVNAEETVVNLDGAAVDCSCSLCCTTEETDFSCDFKKSQLPPRSVCTCRGGCGAGDGMDGVGNRNFHKQLPLFVLGPFFVDNVLRFLF
jgi:hypothetical protein